MIRATDERSIIIIIIIMIILLMNIGSILKLEDSFWDHFWRHGLGLDAEEGCVRRSSKIAS